MTGGGTRSGRFCLGWVVCRHMRWRHDLGMAKSFYKGESLGSLPPCAICMGRGEGERAQLILPGGGRRVAVCCSSVGGVSTSAGGAGFRVFAALRVAGRWLPHGASEAGVGGASGAAVAVGGGAAGAFSAGVVFVAGVAAGGGGPLGVGDFAPPRHRPAQGQGGPGGGAAAVQDDDVPVVRGGPLARRTGGKGEPAPATV